MLHKMIALQTCKASCFRDILVNGKAHGWNKVHLVLKKRENVPHNFVAASSLRESQPNMADIHRHRGKKTTNHCFEQFVNITLMACTSHRWVLYLYSFYQVNLTVGLPSYFIACAITILGNFMMKCSISGRLWWNTRVRKYSYLENGSQWQQFSEVMSRFQVCSLRL